ncbi:NADH-flavin reductase [Stutzerimonas nosocomialis]|uniref:NAD(P)-dependent oxidoreductase n=1 Tax=Stutzerimonas nosocomialis TaxID=1056496 RepID=UPI001109E573|nr:NAD(P)H-binding protein [Stutzerimonas nosocomialis]TLX56325.1 NADH-flavin reductase [Stutzerimonas nosocomialis]
MRNAETPRLKFALYGAHSSLGSALICELLSRQHEAVALMDDLNSLAARPGLRTKLADLQDPESVSESVAGFDAVICLHNSPRLPHSPDHTAPHGPQGFYQAVDALLVGMPRVQVRRLILVADFDALAGAPEVEAALQRLATHPLDWTLVNAPPAGHGLSIDDLSVVPTDKPDDPRYQLRRIAAGIVDELETPRHLHERINFVLES